MWRDYHTFKKYVQDSEYQWINSDIESQNNHITEIEHSWKAIHEASSQDGIKDIFEGISAADAPKSSWCRVLQGLKSVQNCSEHVCLHRENSLEWIIKYLRQHFYHMLFTDEYGATLYGPSGCSFEWLRHGIPEPSSIRHQIFLGWNIWKWGYWSI